ncbi:MAG: protease PrsW [Candidatus Thermoplasmatota archaeon]|nr:protease PrsW [Candidatus Thermoplasmatota archaeon]
MDVLPQASLFLGIIPALLLLYIVLKGYEGMYKDKTVFLTFVVGIILGFIAAVVRSFTLPGMIAYIVLLAFFEQLLKTIVLNMRRFQRKQETTIYGLSLGLGFGSVFTPFLIVAGSASIVGDTTAFAAVAAGSLGIILFHAAMGVFIGYGIYEGKLLKFLFIAIGLQLPFNALMDWSRFYPNVYFFYAQLALILYGLFVFWYVVKKVMPQLLVKGKKRKRSNT